MLFIQSVMTNHSILRQKKTDSSIESLQPLIVINKNNNVINDCRQNLNLSNEWNYKHFIVQLVWCLAYAQFTSVTLEQQKSLNGIVQKLDDMITCKCGNSYKKRSRNHIHFKNKKTSSTRGKMIKTERKRSVYFMLWWTASYAFITNACVSISVRKKNEKKNLSFSSVVYQVEEKKNYAPEIFHTKNSSVKFISCLTFRTRNPNSVISST